MTLSNLSWHRLKAGLPLLAVLCPLSIFYNFTHPSFIAITAPWNILVSGLLSLVQCLLFASVLATTELSALSYTSLKKTLWPFVFACITLATALSYYGNSYDTQSLWWYAIDYAHSVALSITVFAAFAKRQKHSVWRLKSDTA